MSLGIRVRLKIEGEKEKRIDRTIRIYKKAAVIE